MLISESIAELIHKARRDRFVLCEDKSPTAAFENEIIRFIVLFGLANKSYEKRQYL